ncbi:hypothetical protein AgCh_013311 [Apium graveolens]
MIMRLKMTSTRLNSKKKPLIYRFYKWFSEEKEKGEWLNNLQYGVFGLGNRHYDHFKKITKDMDDGLAEQGAKRLVLLGMGDDDQCIEDDFTAWRELVWPELDQLLRDEEDGAAATSYTATVLEYRVVFLDQTDSSLLDRTFSMSNGHASNDAQHPCIANVSVKRELHTPESDRSCTHLEFEISHTGLT